MFITIVLSRSWLSLAGSLEWLSQTCLQAEQDAADAELESADDIKALEECHSGVIHGSHHLIFWPLDELAGSELFLAARVLCIDFLCVLVVCVDLLFVRNSARL